MTKQLTLLLFIGLAWGQSESDSTQVDFYQLGIEAANEDFDPTLSYNVGCSGLGLYLIPLNAMARDVKIPKKHNQVLASSGGDDFRKGYKKELIDLRIESMNKGLNHFLIGAGGLSCYLIFGLIAYGI